MSFFHKPRFKIILASLREIGAPRFAVALARRVRVKSKEYFCLTSSLPIILFSVVLMSLFFPLGVLAQDWNQGLNQFQTQTGLGNQDLATTIGRIVQIVIGFLGLIAVIIIVIGGFMWMTSGGAQDKIDKAKALIKAGVIGMIIIVLSFAAATFIMSLLKKVGGAEGDLNGQACDTSGVCSGCYRCGSDNVWHFDNTCSACNSNSDTFIVNTIQPAPEDVITIRNSVVRIYLNHPVNSATISSNTIIVEQLIDGSNLVVNGDLSLDDVSTIKFMPSSDCPAPNQDRKCFDANGTFKVTVSSQLQSTYNNLFLNCSNGKCFRHFKTNDIVDTQPPQVNIVNISPSQGIYVPRRSNILVTAQANDDSGISKVSFLFDQETVPRFVATSPDSGTIDHYSFTLDASSLDLNSAHTIKATAFDLDNNQSSAEKNIIIRPAHCFNNLKDEDETGVDCGGNDCQTCLTGGDTCGNGQIEPNEQCDGANLNNKTCHLVDPKYLENEGALTCTTNCTFDVSGCVESGTVGGAGDICKISGNTACSTGASTCQNTQGLTTYSCRQANNDCRCCCNPLSPTNTCPTGLTCTGDKSPCSGLNRGLCCGCKDDSQCGGTNVCDTADSCCHNLPTPFNLTFVSQPTQIQISWNYAKDSFKYVTTFQIERAEKKNGVCDAYLKIAEDKNCSQSVLTADYSCSYIDRGNFAGKQWCYRVRAKHGTNTVYSEYSEGATENISSTSGCTTNSSCTGTAACCRLDTKQCVTWDLCGGQCSVGGACQASSILYADADFEVTGAGTGIGACLISVVNIQTGSPNLNQSRGYWLDSIKAAGKRFGSSQGSPIPTSFLVFKNNINSTIISWQDTSIDAQVPASSSFGDNQVIVKKTGFPDSNPVSFTVLKNEVGPGQQCYDNICPSQSGTCSNSPVFSCLTNSGDCRCCCDPAASPDKCKNLSDRLACTADQLDCSGSSRGLCCGCLKDSDCGSNMGCGMKEQDIKCCYSRPVWEDTSFCGGTQSGPYARAEFRMAAIIDPLDNGMPINTDVTLTFSTKMDFGTLNNDNIKISYNSPCQSTEEGKTINGRCYISGTISSYNHDLESQTVVVFSPKSCRLKTSTEYKIEIVVGEDGKGIVSEQGVAMGTSLVSCSWQNKPCQNFTFRTSTNVNNFCSVSTIEVQPSSKTVGEVGVNVDYYAYAKDSAGNAICVNNFTWSSGDSIVATVVASVDPKIGVATSNSKGEATVIASISGKVCVQTPEENRTCGKIIVDLGGPRVIENQDCSDCSLGGQSPSPWKSSIDACINALVVAKFDRSVRVVTLDSNNIKLFACPEGTLENPVLCDNATPLLPVSITPGSNMFLLQLLDSADPPQPKFLDNNTIYKVALKSGDNGIKDYNGYQLDGNRNNLSDGTPKDDYIWYFKTAASGMDTCSLNKVCINPQQAQITPPETQNFSGEVITTNCNYLYTNQFSWAWSQVVIDPWGGLNSVCSLSSSGPQAETTANPVGLGEVYIKGTAQNKSDQVKLIVATQPSVIEHKPDPETACLNQIISATFDQTMNQDSINNSTFRVDYLCDTDTGLPREILNFNNLKNIFVNFWRSLFPKAKAAIMRPYRPAPEYCLIEGNIRTTVSEGKTTVNFIPANILEAGRTYRVTINNILSRYGLPVNYQWTFNVTNNAQICRISKIEVLMTNPLPPSVIDKTGQYLITKTGVYEFSAQAETATGDKIYSVPGYSWDWVWSQSNLAVIGAITTPFEFHDKANIVINNQNGNSDLIATAKFEGDIGNALGLANIEVFLCEHPWLYEANADQTNYELKYCRDSGSPSLQNKAAHCFSGTKDADESGIDCGGKDCQACLLPDLVVSPAGNLGSDMLQNLIIMAKKDNVPTGDVIGLQVYKNLDHLTPIDWYNRFVSNPGSPSSVLVDGYVSAKEGRTVYVGAVNMKDNKLNTNIYLLSYNDGASSETLKIYNQLVANWKFNTNIDFSTGQKASLQRDLSRLYDINDMAKSLEIYKNDNGFYPKLESGSYISGLSTSRWLSWQQTLGQELGKSLPVDPLNQFKAGVCVNCPANDNQCGGTCYNPDQKRYACALGSSIYQYQLKSCGSYDTSSACEDNLGCYWDEAKNPKCQPEYARIYANFEYSNFNYTSINSWDHSCGSYDSSTCATHRWCYWKKSAPEVSRADRFNFKMSLLLEDECRPKIMNYNFKEPCVSPSTCACFNTVYTLKNDPTLAEDPLVDPFSNSAPMASNVKITGTSKVGQVLTGTYTYIDTDGDIEFESTFRWLRDGVEIPDAISQTYTVVISDLGASITFEVTPKAAAGTTPGQAVPSNGTVILNSVPVASGVGIIGTPNVGEILTGAYEYNDVDNDPEGASDFRWYRDGVLISFGATPITSRTYTLVSADSGKTIKFLVRPVAKTGITPGVVQSVSIAINSLPLASGVGITGTPNVYQTLTGTYTYTDADGDTDVSTFRWLRDGVEISSGTITTPPAPITYTLTSADSGKTITFEITPRASAGSTPGVVQSASIAINSLPVASNVTITDINNIYNVGETLTGNYSYYDKEDDADVSTFRWLTNKHSDYLGGPAHYNGDYYVIPGATSKTYTLVSDDLGATITFEITPRASVGSTPGQAVQSVGVIIPNIAPVASNVTITGTLWVGKTLTGNYTYYDANYDLQGISTYQWYRNNTAITGATSKTYKLVSADLGATIKFEVTPKAATGKTPGTTVQSANTAVITGGDGTEGGAI